MAGISFTEGSGVNDSVFGKCQAPIRMFIEKRGEAFEQMSMLKHLFDINEDVYKRQTVNYVFREATSEEAAGYAD